MDTIRIFENKAKKTAVIDIEGYIGFDPWRSWDIDGEKQNTKERIKNELIEIASIKAEEITVNINSYGGDVNHGLSIHDLLAENKAKVITKVNGMTASAATIIAQAGDTRLMSDNALYLIHKASTCVWGNVNELDAVIDDLNRIDARIANIYSKRSGKTVDEMLEVMDEGNHQGIWLSAEEALENGLIDKIYEPTKAAASFNQSVVNNNLSKWGLPAINQDAIDKMGKFPEQKDNKQLSIDNEIPKQINKESEKMDAKQEFLKMKAMFGADKAAEYIENDVSFEDAKDDYIAAIKSDMEELTVANDSATKEIETLKADNEAKDKKISDLEEGADPIPGQNSTEALDSEIEGDEDTDTFMDKVQKIQDEKELKRADAVREAVSEFPELHEAYKTGSDKE